MGSFSFLLFAVLCCCAPLLSTAVWSGRVIRSRTPLSQQLASVRKLIARVLPPHCHDAFRLEGLERTADDSSSVADAFELSDLTIRGTSGVAVAAGLHFYLRHFVNASVHWGRDGTGDNLSRIPKVLPRVRGTIRRATSHVYRYYYNAVTFGYSAAWWDWKRWEREIDWAALHGINLFLALEGQEFVWEKLWTELGLSAEDLDKHYFSGPAFLAWHRMGNLDGYMGPQPPNWRENRRILQKLIVKRMRSLGIVPVLPAFAGHVPELLERKFQTENRHLKVHRGNGRDEGWCGFPPTTILDASDPMFRVIGKRFLELQTEEYGTDSIYSCDTWNEMAVPFTDEPSLRASSAAVIEGMIEADPNAVWLMQGWLFLFRHYWYPNRIAAYLSGVPNDRMVVLDLFAEKRSMWDATDSFYGKPWIWCQLLNFGGNHGMYGNMTRIAEEPSRAARESPSFAGSGMSMESIERNPVMFSMLADAAWTDNPLDIERWLMLYVKSRYIFEPQSPPSAFWNVVLAWKWLNTSVYHFNGQLIKSPMEERPKYYDLRNWEPPLYRPANVIQAVRLFLDAIHERRVVINGPLLYDLTDMTRQFLTDVFIDWLLLFQTCWQMNDAPCLKNMRSVMLDIFDDLDRLLESNVNFMLGPVLQEALVFGPETEMQVRNILSLWGDGRILNDYAAKQWSPMVKNYYRGRWKLFLDAAVQAQVQRKRMFFADFLAQVMQLESEYTTRKEHDNLKPVGNTVDIATELVEKYAPSQNARYEPIENAYPAAQESHIHGVWSHNLGVLSKLCDHLPACGGFTSGGLLFKHGAVLEDLQAKGIMGVISYRKRSGKRSRGGDSVVPTKLLQPTGESELMRNQPRPQDMDENVDQLSRAVSRIKKRHLKRKKQEEVTDAPIGDLQHSDLGGYVLWIVCVVIIVPVSVAVYAFCNSGRRKEKA